MPRVASQPWAKLENPLGVITHPIGWTHPIVQAFSSIFCAKGGTHPIFMLDIPQYPQKETSCPFIEELIMPANQTMPSWIREEFQDLDLPDKRLASRAEAMLRDQYASPEKDAR